MQHTFFLRRLLFFCDTGDSSYNCFILSSIPCSCNLSNRTPWYAWVIFIRLSWWASCRILYCFLCCSKNWACCSLISLRVLLSCSLSCCSVTWVGWWWCLWWRWWLWWLWFWCLWWWLWWPYDSMVLSSKLESVRSVSSDLFKFDFRFRFLYLL